ncbi:MAG: acyl-CoA synthetase [Planctomycetaceae bacterium]
MTPLVAVLGSARLLEGDPRAALAERVGRALVNAGYRLLTGGLGGVMERASVGARSSERYREGMTVAVLPGTDPAEAHDAADIVLPTGLDVGRNILLAHADAVVAIGGGAGTLGEIALAWAMFRLVIALRVEGWSGELADRRIDDRVRYKDISGDRVYGAGDEREVVALLSEWLPRYTRRHHGVRRRR